MIILVESDHDQGLNKLLGKKKVVVITAITVIEKQVTYIKVRACCRLIKAQTGIVNSTWKLNTAGMQSLLVKLPQFCIWSGSFQKQRVPQERGDLGKAAISISALMRNSANCWSWVISLFSAIFQSRACFTADAPFCAYLAVIPFFIFNETVLLLYAFLFQFYLWIFHLLILFHPSFSPCLN